MIHLWMTIVLLFFGRVAKTKRGPMFRRITALAALTVTALVSSLFLSGPAQAFPAGACRNSYPGGWDVQDWNGVTLRLNWSCQWLDVGGSWPLGNAKLKMQ